MKKRSLSVEDVRTALDNGEDIETRPNEEPYPARLVLGMCRLGAVHVAVRDNIDDDEVPAEVCENCGEAYVAEDVTSQLLEIAAGARRAEAQVLVRDFVPAA